jgi:2-phosphosulfolactate phosphatase
MSRPILTHLVPQLVDPEALRGGVAVVIDVLRASTTIVHALAAGCSAIVPVETVEEAITLASELEPDRRLLFGERQGLPIDGFDLGNSPGEFTAARCQGRRGIFTTTNGTKAILRSATADRALIGAFVNFSAICDELVETDRPIHLVCAGQHGAPALEDSILAGAVVDILVDARESELNDSSRIAWDAYEQHGCVLISALELSAGGQLLLSLGLDADLKAAAAVDEFGIVPEYFPAESAIRPTTLRAGPKRFRGESGLWR